MEERAGCELTQQDTLKFWPFEFMAGEIVECTSNAPSKVWMVNDAIFDRWAGRYPTLMTNLVLRSTASSARRSSRCRPPRPTAARVYVRRR